MKRTEIGLMVVFFIFLFFTNIYGHEYIHYLQAGCHHEEDIEFLERMGWWWEGHPWEDEPFYMQPAAFINTGGCPTPERLNEVEPTTFNLVFTAVSSVLFFRFLFKRIRKRECEAFCRYLEC